MGKFFRVVIAVQILGLAFAAAQVGNCPDRPLLGDPISNPLDLYSQSGSLDVFLTMDTGVDTDGYTHYCFNYTTANGDIESPTLRLDPGDNLHMTLLNDLPAAPDSQKNGAGATPKHTMHMGPMHMGPMHMGKTNVAGAQVGPHDPCTGGDVSLSSTNVHFHGLNIPPICHQDDVINTVIQPGDEPFDYQIQIPANEPPGLYWYHPHIHGTTTIQVNGGASGALIVSGIENIKPQVAGLPEQVIILRQQFLNPASWLPGPYQFTLNFETVAQHPLRTLPVIIAEPGEKQFWRVLNSSTQAFIDFQLVYDNVPQAVEMISTDAVPVTNDPMTTDVILPPAGRAEFIMTGPPEGTTAVLWSGGFDTGPVGNPNLTQQLANIESSADVGKRAGKQKIKIPAVHRMPAAKTQTTVKRFANLLSVKPSANRSLYFSEATEGTNGPTSYFLTVAGQTPKMFDASLPPAIVTNVGAVEDWTISNHSSEEHAFHMHQIHFLVMAINGVPLATPVMQDTVNVPYWDGTLPYPSVTVRMDFRDPEIAGSFPYHCHILDHEDGGMMAVIQVNP